MLHTNISNFAGQVRCRLGKSSYSRRLDLFSTNVYFNTKETSFLFDYIARASRPPGGPLGMILGARTRIISEKYNFAYGQKASSTTIY